MLSRPMCVLEAVLVVIIVELVRAIHGRCSRIVCTGMLPQLPQLFDGGRAHRPAACEGCDARKDGKRDPTGSKLRGRRAQNYY